MKTWTLEEGLRLVRSLQTGSKNYGYHVALGGSVLNKGTSEKDIDLYFLPMGNPKFPRKTKELMIWLAEMWGPGQGIGNEYDEKQKKKGYDFDPRQVMKVGDGGMRDWFAEAAAPQRQNPFFVEQHGAWNVNPPAAPAQNLGQAARYYQAVDAAGNLAVHAVPEPPADVPFVNVHLDNEPNAVVGGWQPQGIPAQEIEQAQNPAWGPPQPPQPPQGLVFDEALHMVKARHPEVDFAGNLPREIIDEFDRYVQQLHARYRNQPEAPAKQEANEPQYAYKLKFTRNRDERIDAFIL